MAKIQFVLSDDWGLRSDGSGDMRAIQFDTLAKLFAIYERHGLRGSINAEVMQQLSHRELGGRHPELKALADEWERVVCAALSRGHDVQLHLHSQWIGASYADGRWTLPGSWSILSYPAEQARQLLRRGKQYLERLLRPVKPDYACISFRSGSWCIAPSAHMLGLLVELGIAFDMSIVKGLTCNNDMIHLDYRECDEDFLPYYPELRDARRLADQPTPIVCLPTLSFAEPFGYRMRCDGLRLVNKVLARLGLAPRPTHKAANETPIGQGSNRSGKPYRVWIDRRGVLRKLMNRFTPPTLMADLSALSFPEMKHMIDVVRARAARTDWPLVPVILTNHTKDIGDFGPLEQFAEYVSSQNDLEVITLTEVARNLKAGIYHPVLKQRG